MLGNVWINTLGSNVCWPSIDKVWIWEGGEKSFWRIASVSSILASISFSVSFYGYINNLIISLLAHAVSGEKHLTFCYVETGLPKLLKLFWKLKVSAAKSNEGAGS